MRDQIEKMLQTLAAYTAALEVIETERRALLDQATPAEVKAAIEAINAELLPKLDAASEKIGDLEGQIRTAVLEHGETVRNGELMAVYSKGRVSWDGKKLEGMMALIPQLRQARSEGKPSVSIRKV